MKHLTRHLWAFLLGLALAVTVPSFAGDLESSNFSETAANNNAASPNGAPEGMAPSGVNDTIREVMGALKRDWNRSHCTLASTGSANAYAIAFTTAPTAYVDGAQYCFRANFANTGSASANINALGATTVQKQTSAGLANLASGDIQIGQHVLLEYDSGAAKFILLTPQAGAGLTLPVSVANGGTGLGTLTAHGVLIGAGISNVAPTAAGTAAQILSSGGASADPTFANLAPITTKTTGYTIVAADQRGTFVLNSASNFTFTLPSDTTAGNGWQVCVADQGAGLLTVARVGSDTIASGGSTALTSIQLSQGDAGCVTADGVSNGIFWWRGVRHYDSGQQTITTGANLTLTHALGVQPSSIDVWLHCVTANLSWTAGQELSAGSLYGSNTAGGISVEGDATNIILAVGSPINIVPSGGGGNSGITTANWKWIVRAWVYN